MTAPSFLFIKVAFISTNKNKQKVCVSRHSERGVLGPLHSFGSCGLSYLSVQYSGWNEVWKMKLLTNTVESWDLRVIIVLRNLEKKELEGTSLKNVTSTSMLITNSDSTVPLVLQVH